MKTFPIPRNGPEENNRPSRRRFLKTIALASKCLFHVTMGRFGQRCLAHIVRNARRNMTKNQRDVIGEVEARDSSTQPACACGCPRSRFSPPSSISSDREMRRFRGILAALVALTIAFCSGANDGISENVVVSKATRLIDLTTHVLKINTTTTLENSGSAALQHVHYAVDASHAKHLSFIGATVRISNAHSKAISSTHSSWKNRTIPK